MVGEQTREYLDARLVSLENSINKNMRDREYRLKKMRIMAKECRTYNTNISRLKSIRDDINTVLGKENWNA